ncbi:ribonuclease P protein component [Buchnera aphidicola (Macrosiphoniella sanborni)]|uniref:Ribonuclease P protein component n=1 Tax=Buchnera aphidicola (Macrosiphoniella sanborni) TaxID=1241865 RepID=A0A4D6Y4T0_9GAMM|nr:ribonuclease P protein component [Buchnera aphidicola]QCI23593.1 ribonuclease P protein component [Buchnera aphidicola (Macrosiphoniella sanborni)]
MFNYFFQKNKRLLRSINFKDVFNKPSHKQNTLEASILGRFNTLGYPRLGLSIPRKNIKYAHTRNSIKRLIRETFRLLQHQLLSMDFVVIAKKNIIYLNNKCIIDMLNNLWSHYYN